MHSLYCKDPKPRLKHQQHALRCTEFPASQLRVRRARLVSLVMPMQHAWQI